MSIAAGKSGSVQSASRYDAQPLAGSANASLENIAASVRSRRSVFVKWLRRMHGWIGLWGATLGLLFGSTGILLNHRAVMKIPAAKTQETTLQIALPVPPPPNAKAMAEWLQHELAFDRPASRVRMEPAMPVAWGGSAAMQPPRWSIMFSSPQLTLQAEYWVGNQFVSVKRNDNNLFATLVNLHKGVGAGAAWVLLVDTLAGSIILLSLSGVLLWTLLNRRRMIGAAIGFASLATVTGLALHSL